ncbi:hypothetical protein RCO48_24920 [Peribacillus frigoritolerans]|nr:hypothetical protein [Peribacillus frigoritolerans]
MSKLDGRTVALLGGAEDGRTSVKSFKIFGESRSFARHRGRFSLMIPIWKRMSPG